MLGILSTIFGFATKPLETWQKRKATKEKHKQELLKLVHETKLAEVQARLQQAKTGQVQDYELDRVAIEQMNQSWKDELLLLIFLAPMVLAFIPGMDKYALAGFKVIKQMPDWYVAVVIGMVVVIYGMRGLLKTVLGKKISFKKMK